MQTKHYLIAITALSLILVFLFLQKNIPARWRPVVDSFEEHYEGDKIITDLCRNVGGRMSGTEKGRYAEEWLLDKLRTYGYQDIQTDTFSFLGWQRKTCRLQVAGISDSVTAMAIAMTPDKIEVVADLVDMKNGDAADFERMRIAAVRGKILLIDLRDKPGSRGEHRTVKIRRALEARAAGIIFYSRYGGNIISTGTGSFKNVLPIPVISISRESARLLKDRLKQEAKVQAFISVQNTLFQANSRNIYVDIPGMSLKEEYIVLTTHLDSWDLAEGAIDNGIGISITLNLAKQLKLMKKRFRRSVRLIWFMGEELGLKGSYAYLRQHKAELKNIATLINLDMPEHINGFNLMIDDFNRPVLEQLARDMESLNLQKLVVNVPWLNSDHVPFLLAGVPVLTFVGGNNNYTSKIYHSSRDVLEYVDFSDLKRSSLIVGLTVLELAESQQLKNHHLNAEQVEERLIASGMKEALKLQNLWPFK